MVGFVMTSAEGIDCMHPDKAMPAMHAAARFGIDSIFALLLWIDREQPIVPTRRH